MPPKQKDTKLHQRAIENNLVGFCDFVFWWQKYRR